MFERSRQAFFLQVDLFFVVQETMRRQPFKHHPSNVTHFPQSTTMKILQFAKTLLSLKTALPLIDQLLLFRPDWIGFQHSLSLDATAQGLRRASTHNSNQSTHTLLSSPCLYIDNERSEREKIIFVRSVLYLSVCVCVRLFRHLRLLTALGSAKKKVLWARSIERSHSHL